VGASGTRANTFRQNGRSRRSRLVGHAPILGAKRARLRRSRQQAAAPRRVWRRHASSGVRRYCAFLFRGRSRWGASKCIVSDERSRHHQRRVAPSGRAGGSQEIRLAIKVHETADQHSTVRRRVSLMDRGRVCRRRQRTARGESLEAYCAMRGCRASGSRGWGHRTQTAALYAFQGPPFLIEYAKKFFFKPPGRRREPRAHGCIASLPRLSGSICSSSITAGAPTTTGTSK